MEKNLYKEARLTISEIIDKAALLLSERSIYNDASDSVSAVATVNPSPPIVGVPDFEICH